MNKIRLVLLLSIIPLVACAAKVTDLNLEMDLVVDGDLPAGLQPTQIRKTIPDQFAGLVVPGYQIYRQFTDGENSNGGVMILVYSKVSDAQGAYESISGMLNSEMDTIRDNDTWYVTEEISEIIGPWDTGAASSYEATPLLLSGKTFVSAEATFLQCSAVVYISFYNAQSADVDAIQAYATRLADRLNPIVCQKFIQSN